jgi:hypothetical protein
METQRRRPQKPAHLLSRDLQAAKYARNMHFDDCAKWDYEATNCEECDRHIANVAHLRDQLARARAWESAT